MTNLDEAGTSRGASIANNTPGDPFLAWAGLTGETTLFSRAKLLLWLVSLPQGYRHEAYRRSRNTTPTFTNRRKVALVTGASAGLGESIAAALAKHGMRVVGMARRLEKLEEVKCKMGKVRGEFIPIRGDVKKEEDILNVFKFIKEKMGGLHVLVNNAGIMKNGTMLDGNLEQFREIFDVNVHGLISCTQKGVKLMRESGVDDGHIILLNSLVGHLVPYFPNNSLNVYPASKFSVTALAETLRHELMNAKSHIKVTCISPGLIATEFVTNSLSGANHGVDLDKYLGEMPVLQASDIAEAVIYTLSTPPKTQVCDIIIRPVNDPY